MKSFAAVTLAFLAATISAAPTTRDIQTTTVQFTNDQSGANANVAVNLNVGAVAVKDLLFNTPIDVAGTFDATSFFLQSNFQGVTCDLNVNGADIIVNTNTNFAHIGFPPVDLVAATIYCHATS
jgi:hypothetical protein